MLKLLMATAVLITMFGPHHAMAQSYTLDRAHFASSTNSFLFPHAPEHSIKKLPPLQGMVSAFL
jgi:hypothetical protein